MLTNSKLVTPLVLATAPMAIFNEEQATYSHDQQIIISLNSESFIYSTTFHGTQTYHPSTGAPRDSDND